jgi:hypothetical protein
MKSLAFSVLCLLAISSQLYSVPVTSAEPSAAVVSDTSNHGGKIELKYDGLNHETVSTLKKMKVTCAGAKNTFKDNCVSVSASLHCPGLQLDYVRYAKLQVIFQNKKWDDERHSPEERDLVVVVDATTLRLGRMQLVSQNFGDLMTEVLEATISYDVFKKIASGQTVEMAVGNSRFELRPKNLAALRDLNNRVKVRQ